MLEQLDTDLMFVPEVSAEIRVPVSTLRGWRSRGLGPPGFRVGRHVRYRRADVLEWLEQQAAADRRSA